MSKGSQQIHSPFVFDFYRKVVRASATKSTDSAFKQTKDAAEALKQLKQRIQFQDPSTGKVTDRSLGEIAQKSAKNHRLGKLLGLAVDYLKPEHALELGTSLGISAAYQNTVFQPKALHTIEANTQLVPISKNLWQQLGYQIDLKEGFFELVLPELLQHHSYQWVFIDGNHQYEATMHYFHLFKQHTSPASVLVFDDINWSAGMQQAWKEISADPEVTLCIDLFFLGFVFRNPSFSKETFKLRL